MATEFEEFAGYDSYVEALLAHAHTETVPLSWNQFQKVAVAIARDYADAPAPGRSREYSELRKAVNLQVYGCEVHRRRDSPP